MNTLLEKLGRHCRNRLFLYFRSNDFYYSIPQNLNSESGIKFLAQIQMDQIEVEAAIRELLDSPRETWPHPICVNNLCHTYDIYSHSIS